MNNIPDINTVINVAIISQYKAMQAIKSANFSGNQVVDKMRPRLLYNIRKSVQRAFALNPNDPTLPKTSEFLFGICAPYSQFALTTLANLSQTAPVITGPSNQSVNVGSNATFSVSVVSALPYTLQWYDYLGNPILGANGITYTFLNAQITDSGKTFYVRATSAAGTSVSGTATLTVISPLVGYYYYGSDFSVALLAGTDAVPYQGTFPIVTGQPLSILFPSGAANTFLVIKYPASESTKTSYSNLPLNNGVIPSIAFDHTTIGSWKYVFSRTGNPFGLNTVNPLILS